MKNAWNCDDAFDDMFTDTIGVQWTRKGVTFKNQMNACVYPEETVEVFTETAEDSTVRQIVILISKSEAQIARKEYIPQIGDTLTTLPNDKWKVYDMKECQGWYQLTSRSIDKRGKR